MDQELREMVSSSVEKKRQKRKIRLKKWSLNGLKESLATNNERFHLR